MAVKGTNEVGMRSFFCEGEAPRCLSRVTKLMILIFFEVGIGFLNFRDPFFIYIILGNDLTIRLQIRYTLGEGII